VTVGGNSWIHTTRKVRLWDISTGNEFQSLRGHDRFIQQMTGHRGGQAAAFVAEDASEYVDFTVAGMFENLPRGCAAGARKCF